MLILRTGGQLHLGTRIVVKFELFLCKPIVNSVMLVCKLSNIFKAINILSDNPVCYLVAKDLDKEGQNSVGSTILINRDEHIWGSLWAYYIMIIGMQTL